MSYYIYPAVFEPDDDALKVTFPDLPSVITCGWGIEEALTMAKGALGAYIDMCLDSGESLPPPTPPDMIKISAEGSFVSLIDVDMARFRIQFGSKAIKKTLSLPEWLNAMAEERRINFSAALQEALKEKLGV
jgi:predicted RNase H-like HicB family nuclease